MHYSVQQQPEPSLIN